ncbi:MAG: hypothetical protein IJ242_04420 [Clostridia bacterium]|nr:hypothetical protein [Clostridia bacterium]
MSNRDNCFDPAPKAQPVLKEMAQHFMLVCQIMTTVIDTVPKARLCH